MCRIYAVIDPDFVIPVENNLDNVRQLGSSLLEYMPCTGSDVL